MGLVSVQGLTILLSVSLIVLTGFVVGFVSITTGDRATEDAREAGQRGVESSLKSGRESAEGVTNRLLQKILQEVHLEATGILSTAEMILTDFRNLLRFQHPNATTDAEWFMKNLAPVMGSRIRAAAPLGLSSIFFLAPPISPKAVAEGHGPTEIGGDGKSGMYYAAGVTHDTANHGDDQAVLIYRSAKDAQGKRYLGQPMEFANVDLQDNFYPGPCIQGPKYAEGERTGYCSIPMKFVFHGGFGEVASRGLLNAQHDDGSPLNEPMEVSYTPMVSLVNYLAFLPVITLTHPDQADVWPRQNKRVLMMGMTAVQSKIGRFFSEQVLPPGSVLYGIERDPWTGKVGTLIGTNRGGVKTVEVDVKRNQTYAYPMNVVHHSDVVVSEHGQYALQVGYDELMKSVNAKLTPWRANSTSTVYYTQIKTIERRNLKWYLVLLVPHNEVMGQIDEAMQQTYRDTQQAKKESEEQKQKRFTVMIGVTLAVAVLLMALSVLLTRRIVSPLVRLQQDMQAVATMDLERVQDRRLSSLEEVRSMQEAFKVMVANLREYRNYMPQSILVGQETEDEDSSEKESASDHSKEASNPTHTSSNNTPTQGLVVGLRHRKVTYLVFGLSGWHGFCEKNPEGVVLQTHSELLMMLMQTFLAMKGVPETFSGDRLMGSFNAVKPCSMHQLQAVHVATACVDEAAPILSDGVGINYAVTTGDTRLGNLGCSGMKKFTFISPAMTWAFALERATRLYRCQGLVDSRVAEEVETQYCFRFVEWVVFPKVSQEPIAVSMATERITVQEEEWMYQLQEGQSSNRYREWNLLARCVLRGEWTAAEVLVDKVRELGIAERECTKMANAVTNRQYNPLDILFH